jgi:hypothetical protein
MEIGSPPQEEDERKEVARMVTRVRNVAIQILPKTKPRADQRRVAVFGYVPILLNKDSGWKPTPP